MAYNTGTSPTLAQLITAKFIPDVFSTMVIATLKSKLVIVPLCSHNYQDALSHGSNISIPVFSAATAYQVTPGDLTTVSNVATTPVTITIDKWYAARAEISDMIKIEQLADYLEGATKEVAYAVAKKIDTDVGALFSTLGTSTQGGVYGADGQTFTEDMLIAMTETLDEADVPEDNRAIVGDPSTKADMRKIDRFFPEKDVPTGRIGNLFGHSVNITNNLTATSVGNYGAIFHPDAIGVVIQSNPRTQQVPKPELFVTYLIVDAIWGEDEIGDASGICFYTRKK